MLGDEGSGMDDGGGIADGDSRSLSSGNEYNFFMKDSAEEERAPESPRCSGAGRSAGGRGGAGGQGLDFGHVFRGDRAALENGFKVGVCEDRNSPNRRQMEDCHLSMERLNSRLGDGLFALFDGHSGRSTAELCRDRLGAEFLRIHNANPKKPIPVVLNEVFANINKRGSPRNARNMSGCTAGVAVLRTEARPSSNLANCKCRPGDLEQPVRTLYVANVGDTRIVLCRNGIAHRLSRDHNCRDANEVERVRSAGGVILNSRVNGTLAVTRAIGNISTKPTISGSPYTSEVELTDKDEFFVLACDGLWDVCTDQRAADIVRRLGCPALAAKALITHALDKGSTDNLTVLVVLLDTSHPSLIPSSAPPLLAACRPGVPQTNPASARQQDHRGTPAVP